MTHVNVLAYLAIGRGYVNKNDYEIYKNIVNNINRKSIIAYQCFYSFDHKLFFMMLGLCEYNKYILQYTNKCHIYDKT